MSTKQAIDSFMSQKHIAVAGVSRNSKKFGNVIYKALDEKGYNLYPLNPNIETYGGKRCYASLSDLPSEVTAIVINTKPQVTRELLKEAETRGISKIWLQQGSADKETIEMAQRSSDHIITKQCIMMFAEPVKGIHGFHRWLKKSFGNLPQ